MFPLQAVLPKKIPLALASRRASSSTLLIFVWNFSRSCGRALKAWTVRSAASDSCATYLRVIKESERIYCGDSDLVHFTEGFLRLV